MNQLYLVTPVEFQNTSAQDCDPEWKKLAYGIARLIRRNDMIILLGKNKTRPDYFIALKVRVTVEGKEKFLYKTLAFENFTTASDGLIQASTGFLLDAVFPILNTMNKNN